jgi:hypothetical protein
MNTHSLVSADPLFRPRPSRVFADDAAVVSGHWSGHRPVAGARLALSPLFRAAGRHSLPAASEMLRKGVMEVGTSSATPAGYRPAWHWPAAGGSMRVVR